MREVSREEKKWGAKWHARWVHDVLLVNKGLALVRTIPFAVEDLVASPGPNDGPAIKGLGDQPVSFVVAVDDGLTMEIATSTDLVRIATSPFGVAPGSQDSP